MSSRAKTRGWPTVALRVGSSITQEQVQRQELSPLMPWQGREWERAGEMEHPSSRSPFAHTLGRGYRAYCLFL